jgi:hypothetical protein
MQRVLVYFLAAAFVFGAGSLYAASNVGVESGPPLVTGMGGPDAFGYWWIDSDSAGGPTYQWVDITTKPGAVEITSMMGDDNVVGPFDIGFDFNYYWYTVDHCYIGSNGYISFTDNDNYSHPFSDLPSEARPNNLVCPLGGDIDFSRGDGQLWYWSDDQDSFVVSWIHVSEYLQDPSTDSVHTFQLILTRPDSTLYFMFGEQRGQYSSGPGQARNFVIGMEDVSGTVGLQYCRSGIPTQNEYHDSLAIRFYAIPDTLFEFYDLGVQNAMTEGSVAQICFPGDEVVLRAEFRNNGTDDQTDIQTRVMVRDPQGTEIMRDTMYIASLPAQQSVWVEYSPHLFPAMTGEYAIEFRLYVVDEVPGNNRKIAELRVIEYGGPGTDALFLWDDTTLETCRSWTGDYSGYANEFEAPESFKIKEVRVPIQGVTGGSDGNLIVQIVEQDEFGNPGNVVAEKSVFIPWYQYFQWKTVDFREENVVVEPDFKIWAVGIHENQSTFAFCCDETYTSPRSNRGWEFTGILAPDRHRETSDVGIRMLVEWLGEEVSMSCETLSPTFCKGKHFYFAVTYHNATQSPINTRVTLRGYAGHDCDPGSILITLPRNRTIPIGTNTYYYFLKVPGAIGGDLSASLEFEYQGTHFCCMNTSAVQCRSWTSGLNNEWEWGDVSEQQVELSCEAMSPTFCRGKNLYFTTTVTNNSGGNVSGRLTFSGYSGYGCDPGNVLAEVPANKSYAPGVTETDYFFKVPNAAAPGPYSASVSGSLSGHEVFCCMDVDITECQGWRIGGNTEWELVEVNRQEVALPSLTSLGQNYPNPFNATTKIGYDLATAGSVTLKIYDISGRLVETLVDRYQEAGSYTASWNASGISSGVYFYKLSTADYTCTKKMNLLR